MNADKQTSFIVIVADGQYKIFACCVLDHHRDFTNSIMYWLDENGSRRVDAGGFYTTCSPGDSRWGCSAFCDEPYPFPCEASQTLTYPYTTNPITIPIETDYLLDIVSQEVSPDVFHPAAIRAQAIAARSYAYWHITHTATINNSASYQVFIPYRFEALEPVTFPDNEDNPCASTNLNASQQRVCDAVQLLRYITYEGQPAFTEFFADIRLHTLTNPTDANSDGQLDYPYLLGIQDPISWEPTIIEGHGHGMSQKGASRWRWGNSGYRGNLTPWAGALGTRRANPDALLHRH